MENPKTTSPIICFDHINLNIPDTNEIKKLFEESK